MSIQIGKTYSLLFKVDFTALDGIYHVTHSIDYDSILEDDINLLDFLYIKVGKIQADLTADIPTIKLDTFHRIVNVDTEEVVYVPRNFIVGIPDPDVNEYSKLMLTVDLGPFADPALLTSISSSVNQSLTQVAGVNNTADVIEYDKQWMSGNDYQNIVDSREATKGGAINYHKLFIDQQADNLKLAARIAALEQLVVALDAAP